MPACGGTTPCWSHVSHGILVVASLILCYVVFDSQRTLRRERALRQADAEAYETEMRATKERLSAAEEKLRYDPARTVYEATAATALSDFFGPATYSKKASAGEALSHMPYDSSASYRRTTECCECQSTTLPNWDNWRITEGEGEGCEFSTSDLACLQTPNYPNNYPVSTGCKIEITRFPSYMVAVEDWTVESRFFDFLEVEGAMYGGARPPPSIPFWPTASDVWAWSSDHTVTQRGWRICLRLSCEGFVCPGGYSLRENASSVGCSGLNCTDEDIETCCERECLDPLRLSDEYTTTEGCSDGNPYISDDCFIGCSGNAQLDGWSPPQQCRSNGTIKPPSCEASSGRREFPFAIRGSCQRYGLGCVSSNGVGTPYSGNEACIVTYNLPEGHDNFDYDMHITYLDVQAGDRLIVAVDAPSSCTVNADIRDACYYNHYYFGTFFLDWEHAEEWMGTASETRSLTGRRRRRSARTAPLQNIFWTSDGAVQGTGWIVCVTGRCANSAHCPAGYRFNCEAENRRCGSHDCTSPVDVETCCIHETQEDADLYGFTIGQAWNITWCYSTTTTTTTYKPKPDFVGHLHLALTEMAPGEFIENRTDLMRTVLWDAFPQLGAVDILDVQLEFLILGNGTSAEIAFRVEQTDTRMTDLSDAEYIEVINMHANKSLVEAFNDRLIHEAPPTTLDARGFRRYGSGCVDLYPCNGASCWLEYYRRKTCAELNELDICRPGRQPGPAYASSFNTHDGTFEIVMGRSGRSPAGPEPLDEVCCSCGGGHCDAGTYRIKVDGTDNMPTYCMPCEPGSSSPGRDPQECVQCEPGRFAATWASSECKACPAGQFSTGYGLTACSDCGAGTVTLKEGQTMCEECPEGTASSAAGDACDDCSPGRFSAMNGTSECEACDVGRFAADPRMTGCEDCSVGEFVGSTEASRCILCEKGRFAGSNASSACEDCSPGEAQALDGASACEACPPAYFARQQGETECLMCAAGTDSTENGASACDRCQPGFAKAASELFCTSCAAGSYAAEPGLTGCRVCDIGEHASEPEAARSCLECELGRYGPTAGLTSCSACSAGTFASEERASACIECIPGEFANVTGLASCYPCSPGSFAPLSGQVVCEDCSPGHEAPGSASLKCDVCAAGRFSPAAGTSTCADCSSGLFSPLQGSTACVICEPGRFSASAGTSECPYCELGRYANSTGSTRCRRCNETRPGEPEFWTTMAEPTEEDPVRPSGIKAWRELRGATSSSSCGCRPGTQPHETGVCEECGEGLICLGMGVLEIEEGYAWDGEYSTWDCEKGDEDACPGGVPGRCMPGRNEKAIACAICLEGLVPREDGSCDKCTDTDYMVPAVAMISGFAIAILVYLVFDSPKRKRPKLSFLLIVASLGQAVTIIQQLGIISLIRVEWSNPLLSVFNFIGSITFFDVQVLRPSCLASMDVVRMYAIRVLLVFICLGVVIVAHCASQLLQHRHDWRTRWPTLWCALGTILLTFFVSILSTMLGPLQCRRHPNSRQTVSWYPSIACWEGGEHSRMIIIGSIACLLPLIFLAMSIWAVRNFPRSLMHAKTKFLNTWAFLFFRYTAEAYWYGPAMLVRNGVIAVVPVITSAALQILALEVVMLISLMTLLSIMPWRVAKANYLDAAGHFCLLLVTMMASFYVDQDNTHFISVLSVVLIAALPVLLLLVLVYALTLLVRSFARRFQFFLCHHKLGTGCFSRLLKMALLKTNGVRRKVFIDADDLTNLDTLFDLVAHETETLVAINSQNLLQRPWCVGEITTAHRSRIRMMPIYMPGVSAPSEEFITNFLTYVQDISCLTQFSIDVTMIEDALRWLAGSPFLRMPEELHDSTLDALCSSLVAGKASNETLSDNPVSHTVNPEVAIISNKVDLEAAATSMILRNLLNPIIQAQETSLSFVLGTEEKVPRSVKKGILVCTNGVFTNQVLEALLTCRAQNSVLLPVMSVTNFVIPSEAWMTQQAAFERLPEDRRHNAYIIIQAIFTEIAVDFQPSALSGTEATLNTKAYEVASRLFGGMTSLSDKVSEMDRKLNKKDRQGSFVDKRSTASLPEPFRGDILPGHPSAKKAPSVKEEDVDSNLAERVSSIQTQTSARAPSIAEDDGNNTGPMLRVPPDMRLIFDEGDDTDYIFAM